jgi:ABC-type oligopeptide transport system ATPase subunit
MEKAMAKDWKQIAAQRLNENKELRRWIKKNAVWDRKCNKETVDFITQVQVMQKQIAEMLTKIQLRADVAVRYPEKIPGEK